MDWEKVYAGHVSYRVDQWTVVAFNDCDEFDYIEYMQTPDGRKGDFNGFREGDGLGPEEILERRGDPALYEQRIRAFVEAR